MDFKEFGNTILRLETSWRAEKNSNPTSIEEGKYLVENLYENSLDFKVQISTKISDKFEENLELSDLEVYQDSIKRTLEDAGYYPYLSAKDRLSNHYDNGHKKIFLTDKKSWYREIHKNELILIARPN